MCQSTAISPENASLYQGTLSLVQRDAMSEHCGHVTLGDQSVRATFDRRTPGCHSFTNPFIAETHRMEQVTQKISLVDCAAGTEDSVSISWQRQGSATENTPSVGFHHGKLQLCVFDESCGRRL